MDELQIQLKKALEECARLKDENARLRQRLGMSPSTPPADPLRQNKSSRLITNDSPAENKIKLFRSLFRGREDVYAVRWEGKNGKSGYSPACANEWNRNYCGKPKVKCSRCDNRELLPLTDAVVHAHLMGKQIIGVYPLLSDERTWFLSADFDKVSWQEDVGEFLATCSEMGIPAALERSRSGRGGHVWTFFTEPIPAKQARRLGSALLTHTMEKRHQIGLDSYDRFFPNQDTMPKGGFGNLIALPLQRRPRENGNSLFLNRDLEPYSDQWEYLCLLKRVTPGQVDSIVNEAARSGKIMDVRMSFTEQEGDLDPWESLPSGKRIEKPLEGPLPNKLSIVVGNMIYVGKQDLSPAIMNRLMRLAAFQNPEFYKAQAMRLSTFGKPRVISCSEDFPEHTGLPRGCWNDLRNMLNTYHIDMEVKDERSTGHSVAVDFHGELRPLQKEAAHALMHHDNGILSAATAFGKTVVAAWLIAARKVNTLIIVHRKQLLDQWRERLSVFLGLPRESIGQVGGGKAKLTGIVDVALIQSLNRKGEVKDLVGDYGHVIVDECHHVSAFSFEQVLKQVKARFVLGLTATPVRKDGHHPIIMMQCGPIRYQVKARGQAKARPFAHKVIPRKTSFRMDPMADFISDKQGRSATPAIQNIYASLVVHEGRNNLIFDDLLKVLEEHRSPLVLTERTEHLDLLADRLKGFARNVIVLRGGMGKKQRQAVYDRIAVIPDDEERVILATGRYIGEGYDDARLDTLFLVMPISWKGTLQQYAGRLHRHHDKKREVRIYDYVDVHVPMLMRMYEKRLKGYSSMGYVLQEGRENSGV